MNNNLYNIVIEMDTRCGNDNLRKTSSRICPKRLVNKSPSPCPSHLHSPTQADRRVVRVCMPSLEITLAASFLVGRGRHRYKIHERLFEEISFGDQKLTQ